MKFELSNILFYKWRLKSAWILHFSLLIILAGALVTHFTGTQGRMHLREGQSSNEVQILVGDEIQLEHLPFQLKLRDFILTRYAGSNSPSSYVSELLVRDAERNVTMHARIFMNKTLNYRGYRFFQSSFDADERGSILTVSHDFWGTLISYIGYVLLAIGMIWNLFDTKGRFREMLRRSKEMQGKRLDLLKKVGILVLALSSVSMLRAAETTKEQHLRQVASLLVQDANQGRMEPFGTYSADIFRKLAKKTSYFSATPTEVLLGMLTNAEYWQNEPIIKVSNVELAEELGAVDGYLSFNQLFDFENDGEYRLRKKVEAVYQKEMAQRSKYDKELLSLDERCNICFEIYSGKMPGFFPVPKQPNAKWLTVSDNLERLYPYFTAVRMANKSGKWDQAEKSLKAIQAYQRSLGGKSLPSKFKVRMELTYNNWNIFGKLARIYLIAGFLLLLLHLLYIFNFTTHWYELLERAAVLFWLFFAFHTLGLMLRWYVSGHAPWSNGYETMVFVGWATSLSGLLFAKRLPITVPIASVLSGIALSVAGMSWMNPEITPLVPVLKSYWLIIHVAVITSSYGFLAMGALLGLTNLVLMTARRTERLAHSIREIACIIELALTIGLVMLTIGVFLGAVWANESWGSYWSWDPKETWALISILTYAAILHARLFPKWDHEFVLSCLAVLGLSSILMTFFGVNYFMSGMHSYAQGTPPSVSASLLVGVVGLFCLIFFAWKSYKKYRLNA